MARRKSESSSKETILSRAPRAGLVALVAAPLSLAFASACSTESSSGTQFRFEKNGANYIFYAAAKPDPAKARFCFITMEVTPSERDAIIGAGNPDSLGGGGLADLVKTKANGKQLAVLNEKSLGLDSLSGSMNSSKDAAKYGWGSVEEAKAFLASVVSAVAHETVDKAAEQAKQGDADSLVVARRKGFDTILKEAKGESDATACSFTVASTTAAGAPQTTTVSPDGKTVTTTTNPDGSKSTTTSTRTGDTTETKTSTSTSTRSGTPTVTGSVGGVDLSAFLAALGMSLGKGASATPSAGPQPSSAQREHDARRAKLRSDAVASCLAFFGGDTAMCRPSQPPAPRPSATALADEE